MLISPPVSFPASIWRVSSPEFRRLWASWGAVSLRRSCSALRWAGGLPWAFRSASSNPWGQLVPSGGILASLPDRSSSSFRQTACW